MKPASLREEAIRRYDDGRGERPASIARALKVSPETVFRWVRGWTPKQRIGTLKHDEVIRLHRRGLSLKQIGDQLGVSRQRVHQILRSTLHQQSNVILMPQTKLLLTAKQLAEKIGVPKTIVTEACRCGYIKAHRLGLYGGTRDPWIIDEPIETAVEKLTFKRRNMLRPNYGKGPYASIVRQVNDIGERLSRIEHLLALLTRDKNEREESE